MEWGDPKAILWMLLVPFLGLIWIVSDRLRSLFFSNLGEREVVINFLRRFSPKEVVIRRLLLSLAVILLVFSVMQPRKVIGTKKVEMEVLNLVFALDCSYSMLAQDLKPNRLTRAKMEIASLLNRLKGDRVALVVFSGQALVQCPLTYDYEAFKSFLDAVEVGSVPKPGTNISSALAKSLALIEEAGGNGVIVLITDGEDFSPEKAIDWARRCRKKGVKVYCIGIGSDKGEPIPLPGGGFKKDKEGNIVLTRLDEALLIKIAQITGGAYLRAGSGSIQVNRMYDLILQEKRKKDKAGIVPEYAQYYVYLTSLALVVLTLVWFLPLIPGEVKTLSRVSLILAWISVLGGWSLSDLKLNELLRRYEKGDKEVVAKLEEMRERHPEDPILNYDLGTIKAKEGQDPEKYLQISAQQDSPVRAKAFYNLGNYYLGKNQVEKAIAAYKEALILDPNFVDARYNLELALKKLKKEQNQRSQLKEREKKGEEQRKNQGSQGKKEKSNRNERRGSKEQREKETKENEEKARAGQSRSDQDQRRGENRENLEGKGKERNDQGETKEGQRYNEEGGQDSNPSRQYSQPDLATVLSALKEDELKPSQVNKKRGVRGGYDVEKDW